MKPMWITGIQFYFGDNGFRIESGPKYDSLIISGKSDRDTFKRDLKTHQEGRTDFPRFCSEAARAGVEKWVVDTGSLTCTYFDKNGKVLVEESIPDLS